jgi:hypothetical protein
VLGDLVAAGDTKVDTALANEGWDVGGGQENESDGQVLDQRDVETGLATELDVAAGEEVKGGLLQAALCLENVVLVVMVSLFAPKLLVVIGSSRGVERCFCAHG